jgi:ribose 5-phosphate isomerase A
MPDLDAEKKLAAIRAVDEVRDGMLLGLGTGSTAEHAIRILGERVAEGLKIEGVATSARSAVLARSLGIGVVDGESVGRLDLVIDGADEIDGQMHAIKGGGGALLREKVVASAADRVIVIVDSSKVVERLGNFPLPLEVLPFAAAWTKRAVERLGGVPVLRSASDQPYRTDQGNYIFDVAFRSLEPYEELATELERIPGVIEHGLFLTQIDTLIVGQGKVVEVLERSEGR